MGPCSCRAVSAAWPDSLRTGTSFSSRSRSMRRPVFRIRRRGHFPKKVPPSDTRGDIIPRLQCSAAAGNQCGMGRDKARYFRAREQLGPFADHVGVARRDAERFHEYWADPSFGTPISLQPVSTPGKQAINFGGMSGRNVDPTQLAAISCGHLARIATGVRRPTLRSYHGPGCWRTNSRSSSDSRSSAIGNFTSKTGVLRQWRCTAWKSFGMASRLAAVRWIRTTAWKVSRMPSGFRGSSASIQMATTNSTTVGTCRRFRDPDQDPTTIRLLDVNRTQDFTDNNGNGVYDAGDTINQEPFAANVVVDAYRVWDGVAGSERQSLDS